MKKPVVIVVGLFITGIICGRYFLPAFFSAFLILVIFAAAAAVFFFKKNSFSRIFTFSSFFLMGITYFCLFFYPSPLNIMWYADSGKVFEIKGKIVSPPYFSSSKTISFVLDAHYLKEENSPTPEKTEGKIWVNSFYPYLNYGYGDIVSIRGKVSLPSATGKGKFNWQNYLAYQQIFSQVNTGKVKIIEKSKGNPLFLFAHTNAQWMKNVIDKALPYPYSATLKGIMLGEKEDLPPQILSSFRKTGTAHILVVSGLHVGLLLFAVVTLARIAGIPQKIAFLIAIPVIIYYTILTGMRAPILRASLMAIIGLFCFFIERDVPLIVILSLAAFIILLINPLSIFTVSFQLSFLAVGGIVHTLPYLEEKLYFLPPIIKRTFSLSLAAQLSLLPVFAFYFQQLPLIGILANLVITPLLTPVVLLGFLSTIFAIFSMQIAQIFFNSSWLFLKAGIFAVEFLSFSWIPEFAWIFSPKVASPSVWTVVIYYLLFFLLPFSGSFKISKGNNARKSEKTS